MTIYLIGEASRIRGQNRKNYLIQFNESQIIVKQEIYKSD